MSPGIGFHVHFWRGIGPDIQRDLFVWRYRLGFVTLAIERADIMPAYRKLRSAIEQSVTTAGLRSLAQAHQREACRRLDRNDEEGR